MPEFLPPERAWFGTRADGFPVAVLAVGAAAGSVDGVVSGEAHELDEWQIMVRPTVTVVDGPGDLGFLVAADPGAFEGSLAWAQRLEEIGVALVLFVDDEALLQTDVEALLQLRPRGGLVRIVG